MKKLFSVTFRGENFVTTGFLFIGDSAVRECVLDDAYIIIPPVNNNGNLVFRYINLEDGSEKLLETSCSELYIPDSYILTAVENQQEYYYFEISSEGNSFTEKQRSMIEKMFSDAREKFSHWKYTERKKGTT